MKIHLLYIGKRRSREANLLAEDYARRIGRYCTFRMAEIKNEKAAEAYGRAVKVVLDPGGETLSSRQFAKFIETCSGEIAFFVGGADGFSGSFRDGADRLLSLSRMTLPHELARVVLAEQIYRAFAILGNHPYAR